MATTPESTTTRTRRMSAGCPCASARPGRLPDEPTQELIYSRTDWTTALLPAIEHPLPLPPVCAVAEALDDLARGSGDPSLYLLARAHLIAGVAAAFDGTTRWVGEVAVHMAPEGLRWPWYWCCSACGATPCWHSALCDALLLAETRLADEVDDLPLEEAPHHHPSYTTLLLVSGVSLLILWAVPFPTAAQSPLSLQALGSAASALVSGW